MIVMYISYPFPGIVSAIFFFINRDLRVKAKPLTDYYYYY